MYYTRKTVQSFSSMLIGILLTVLSQVGAIQNDCELLGDMEGYPLSKICAGGTSLGRSVLVDMYDTNNLGLGTCRCKALVQSPSGTTSLSISNFKDLGPNMGCGSYVEVQRADGEKVIQECRYGAASMAVEDGDVVTVTLVRKPQSDSRYCLLLTLESLSSSTNLTCSNDIETTSTLTTTQSTSSTTSQTLKLSTTSIPTTPHDSTSKPTQLPLSPHPTTTQSTTKQQTTTTQSTTKQSTTIQSTKKQPTTTQSTTKQPTTTQSTTKQPTITQSTTKQPTTTQSTTEQPTTTQSTTKLTTTTTQSTTKQPTITQSTTKLTTTTQSTTEQPTITQSTTKLTTTTTQSTTKQPTITQSTTKLTTTTTQSTTEQPTITQSTTKLTTTTTQSTTKQPTTTQSTTKQPTTTQITSMQTTSPTTAKELTQSFTSPDAIIASSSTITSTPMTTPGTAVDGETNTSQDNLNIIIPTVVGGFFLLIVFLVIRVYCCSAKRTYMGFGSYSNPEYSKFTSRKSHFDRSIHDRRDEDMKEIITHDYSAFPSSPPPCQPLPAGSHVHPITHQHNTCDNPLFDDTTDSEIGSSVGSTSSVVAVSGSSSTGKAGITDVAPEAPLYAVVNKGPSKDNMTFIQI